MVWYNVSASAVPKHTDRWSSAGAGQEATAAAATTATGLPEATAAAAGWTTVQQVPSATADCEF